jgi:ABC-type lipoprotein release transport system permease subunit
VIAQIRTHPAVERVIPSGDFGWLEAVVPPFGYADVRTYAVSAEDMAYLVELYDLKLKEGHLPRPRTNEVIISEATAQNRNLKVGDIIGDPDHPAYPGAEAMSFELVISGIFARPTASEDENWLAFMSLEFLTGLRGFSNELALLVISKAGEKAVLEDWLESEIADHQVGVTTYRSVATRAKEETQTLLLTTALIETVVIIAATSALAILNYIFVIQRGPEFGVLHALGHSRLYLVWRTMRETIFVIGIAWGLSLMLCLAELLYLQFALFDPRGLRLNFFNPLPWLFTVPIPVTVLIVTIGTIVWRSFKLDPVAIIEGR